MSGRIYPRGQKQNNMELFTDPLPILKAIGMIGLFCIIFVESGLLIGIFLPGDSILFTAGLLASQGFFPIIPLIVGCVIAAILGDSVGYYLGKITGDKIFTRDNSLFFHKDNLQKAKVFYEKHGKKTIVLSRFIPIIRSFTPMLAGIGKMHYRTFLTYNIIGGLTWCVSVILIGYFLGTQIPNIEQYVLPIVGIIIIISFVPLLFAKFKK